MSDELKNPIADAPSMGIAMVIILYLLVLLPVLPQVSTYHSDEHYYTNSAVYMLKHHDLLNPYYADGSLRTKKPIIGYWALMAAYTLLGVNFFAARLPFLLAGGLTLWLTYRISQQFFPGRMRGIMAAVILGSNLQFISLSVRATPDIFQILFITLSFYGFIALIFQKDLRLRNYGFAYIGAALAILTKGALGVVLIGFVLPFYYFSKDSARPFKQILHWPMIVAAIALAASWYLYIIGAHGAGALWSFVSDQMVEKVGGSRFYVLMNVKDYLWGVFRNFLPWALVLLFGIKYCWVVQGYYQHHKKDVAFVLGWFLVMFLILIGINDCRTRYIAPAYPLLSVLLGALLVDLFGQAGAQRFWRWVCAFLAVTFVLISLLLFVLGFVLDKQLLIASVLIMSGIAGSVYFLTRLKAPASAMAMGMLLLVTFASLQGFVVPVFEFAPSKQIAACLLREDKGDTRVSIWSRGRANYLRQLYSLTNGRVMVEYFAGGKLPPDLGNRKIVVLTEDDRKSIDIDRYEIKPCGAVFKLPGLKALSQALMTGDKAIAFKAMQETIYLARRFT